MKNAFRRIAIVPFEMAIAILALGSGITGLLHIGFIDPVSQLLPNWEADSLNTSLILCGIAMAMGVITGSGAIESVGLWLLNATIIARFILYGHFLHYGAEFVLTGVFDLAIILASTVRLWSIRTRHTLLRAREVIDVNDLLS